MHLQALIMKGIKNFQRYILLILINNAFQAGVDMYHVSSFVSLQSFKQMIASCLVKDPSKRPPASKLLKHSFFKQARSNDYISRTLLEGLPVLGDRIKALKVGILFW